ncbi:Ig-like domain-containing protein [Cellulomonas bogoriensis]|uniref:Fibronectin n=1 Tax=Cellulomonas bogoriensis 69B4 = DSM 16987 TaxID=1386082 RepID=A0A0A0C4F2_9CELL|nr:Ig-like domain-containing protein [Cellulomonas bogoriensis]KGM14219.1 fibronectin [Cellulomonas bogoriensis 69B4 = DSM 16987]
MLQRPLAALAVLGVLVVAVTTHAPQESSAAFTATTTTTASVAAAADWTPPTVALTHPGATVTGTVALTATAADAESGIAHVTLERRAVGTTAWTTVCTRTAAPYTCSWDTTTHADGSHDLRARAVDGAGLATTTEPVRTVVDNEAPEVALTDPGSPLTGTFTVTATAHDTGSGLAGIRVQAAPSGTATWTDMCGGTTSPLTCAADATTLPAGSYDLRAVAVDAAGNTNTSAVVLDRQVVANVSTITLQDPGPTLRGTVNLVADASSTAGVTSVTLQVAPTGSSTWTDVCTLPRAPYQCDLDTRVVPDGTYDLRAVLLDATGTRTTSPTRSGVRVVNTPLQAHDIQAVNGPGVAGQVDAGDVITFTYSGVVDLATVTPGWNGQPLAVTTRLRSGGLVGNGNSNDVLDVQRAGSVVHLGSVDLNQNYINPHSTATFAATMTAATAPGPEGDRTVITVVLGARTSGPAGRVVNPAATMVWTPSASVTDVFGLPVSPTPATELGPVDTDF